MEYLTSSELSKKWNISSRMIAYYCENGRIEGAVKKGKTWFVPAHSEKPADRRCSKKKINTADNITIKPKAINEIEKTDAIYHTGEVYNHLGFSRETLRYYEEIGLISPKREKYSQYREFGFYDMSHLMAIDFYKKRGFTPIQIKKLLKVTKSQEYKTILQEQMDTLKNDIDHLQEMLNRLEKAKDFYDYATDKIGEFEIKTMPSYYVQESISSVASFSEYREKVLKYLNLDNEDILSNMVRAITFDETGCKGSGMYIVMQLPSGNKENLFIKGGKCLYTTLIADNNDNTVIEKMFSLCHKWAKEHNVSLRGIVYIFIRFVTLREQTDKNYYEIWLPLK